MNKAFVKETDLEEPRCPAPRGCGGPGAPVTRDTLLAQLPDEHARSFSKTAFYCANPACEVAYFDAWGATAPRSALRAAAYPKSGSAPVCSCFGFTAEEIRRAAEEGRKDQVKAMLARAESDEARCPTEAPSGASCVPEIRRIFMKHFDAE